MSQPAATDGLGRAGARSRSDRHYRELFWGTVGRLLLLYFVPLLLLAVFFNIQYRRLVRDGLRAHLQVIAEHQAATFDLFLRERLANLDHLVTDPAFAGTASDLAQLRTFLDELRQTSDAFVDLGVVDAEGRLAAYVGPVDFQEPVSYHSEDWFQALVSADRDWIITEIYLGFRGSPHFTIAVRRDSEEPRFILRSTLSPERLTEYLTSLEGASEVHAAVVSGAGALQLATVRGGALPEAASLSPPPTDPPRGFVTRSGAGGGLDYAYAWLRETPWALIVTSAGASAPGGLAGPPALASFATLGVFLAMGALILVRSRQVAGRQLATERTEAELSGQLVQAEKLASVGELAAGIAHEINNPLAIIAEEVGLLKDSLDPALVRPDDPPVVLGPHLDVIHDAVFRCRDITRKLLTFVRKSEVTVGSHDVHVILDDVATVMLGNELAISNVAVVREYDTSLPPVLVDRNQLAQVFVNLVKNAIDAMPSGGTLTLATRRQDTHAAIVVRDTGVGMTREQLQRVFMPFYTTKDPGKGTGLGLSVSTLIIQGYEGRLFAESAPGRGSAFTVELPLPAGTRP